jgi:hypothetical protein
MNDRPAFPTQYSNEADGSTVMPSEGMTLREYYAGLAMQGLLARHPFGGHTESISIDAVTLADALIAELAKEKA